MKKSYYCKRLDETIVFDALKIFYCCATRTGPGIEIPQRNIAKEILKYRKTQIKNLLKGNVPTECVGCFDLKEFDTPMPFYKQIFHKISKPRILIVKHFKQCDCSCIYCAEQYLSNRKLVLKPQKSDYYDLYPIIQEFYKKNILDNKNLEVLFQGGNISVLDEFEDLVNIFVDNGAKKIELAINNIKYLPIIEKICHKTFVDMDISIDCGSKETFQRLKVVDKFDDVVNNLKRYLKLPVQIRLKYILIKGVNDNIEELSKYIELMKELGIKISELVLDQCDPDFQQGKDFVIPPHYYELYDFWENKCKEYGIYPSLWAYLKEILNKGKFFK